MNNKNVSPTALSSGDTAHLDGRPGGPAVVPPRSEAAGRPSRSTAGRVPALLIGALLVLTSVALLGIGGTVLWADRTQRDGGYVTTDVHQFSTPGSALATEPTQLGATGTGWLYAPALLDSVRIRVTDANPGPPLFVGIGPSADVDRYLAGVNHTVITDFRTDTVEFQSGGAPASAPETQDFWVASSTGPGTRTLTWNLTNGSWTVVVMNADRRPGIDVRADLGARIPALLWIAVGLLLAGAVFAAGGALLITGAIHRRPADPGEDRMTDGTRSHAGAPTT
jgi:hypothetical protein